MTVFLEWLQAQLQLTVQIGIYISFGYCLGLLSAAANQKEKVANRYQRQRNQSQAHK